MKRDLYKLTYWVRVQKELSIDLAYLAQLLIDDCPEESGNHDINGILEYFGDNSEKYLAMFGLPPESLEEDGDFICSCLYEETSEDLATIIGELLNSDEEL